MGKRRERESAAKFAASQKAKREKLGGPSGMTGGSDLGDSRGGHSDLPRAPSSSDDGQHGPYDAAGDYNMRDSGQCSSDLPPHPSSDNKHDDPSGATCDSNMRDSSQCSSDLPPHPGSDNRHDDSSDGVHSYEVGESSDFGGGALQRCYSYGVDGPRGGGGSGPPGGGGGPVGSGGNYLHGGGGDNLLGGSGGSYFHGGDGGGGPYYFFTYEGPHFYTHSPSYHGTHIHTHTHSPSYHGTHTHTHTYSSNRTHIGSTPTYESTWISQMQVFAITNLAIYVTLVVGLLSTRPSESVIYYACLEKVVLAGILCVIMLTHTQIKFLADYGEAVLAGIPSGYISLDTRGTWASLYRYPSSFFVIEAYLAYSHVLQRLLE